MKKYLWMIVLLTVVSGNAWGQMTHLDSAKRLRPRFAKTMGFFVFPNAGGDAWPWAADASHQGYGPMQWSGISGWRWLDVPECDSVGSNAFTGHTFWHWMGDSSKYDAGNAVWKASTPDTFASDPREPHTLYSYSGTEPVYDAIANALWIRFECERHPMRGKALEYPGFWADSILTGINAYDTAGTSPPWLAGTPDSADLTNNIVRLHKGIDGPGLFCRSYSRNSFLSNGDSVRWWAGDNNWNRKLVLRIRVRLDSLSTSDSISQIMTHVTQDSAVRLRVLQSGVVKLDTGFLITRQNFPHASIGFDTLAARFLSDSNTVPGPIDFQLSWQGHCSMSVDYLEVATARIDTTDAPIAGLLRLNGYFLDSNAISQGVGKTLSYEGLTANGDFALKDLLSRTVYPFDSLLDLLSAGEEIPIGKMYLTKRIEKLLQTTSIRTESILQTLYDQNYVYPSSDNLYGYGLLNQPTFFVEGVHRGWLDSSRYADPLIFGIDPYVWQMAIPLPVRTKSSDTSVIGAWLLRYFPSGLGWPFADRYINYDHVTHDRMAEQALENILKGVRWAHGATLRTRTPQFHQRFYASLQSGGQIYTWTDTAAGHGNKQSAYYWQDGLRNLTAAEYKSQVHTAVAAGTSGIKIYWLFSGLSSDNGGDGGLIGNGGDTSQFVTIPNLNNGTGGTYTDTVWTGWRERFDTAKSLFPLVTRYGNALLASDWLGDFLVPELRADDSLPFQWNSLRALDDSSRMDLYSTNADSNRTYVFVSVWRDTTTHDTLLYIVNTRTDDSWDTSGKCQTFDRRYITMQMKARHLVTDVADTLALRTMGKVRTPYVGAGDSLVVWLLPGDGVLVRLTAADTSMKQMRIALNYPKQPPSHPQENVYDHGKIKFSDYVVGVSHADSTIPSSMYSYVGIRNSQAPTLHQDSLLYQKFLAARPEKWRHQNWDIGTGLIYKFKNSLPASSTRSRQLGSDSIAHQIVIKTDLEGTSEAGEVRLFDPFFVDSVSLRNYNTSSDTLDKLSPFLPQVPLPGSIPGANPQHYGGVYLKQNVNLFSSLPTYGIAAYPILQAGSLTPMPGPPSPGDWVFVRWQTNDTPDALNPTPWPNSIWSGLNSSVVFMRDSAVYRAEYKAHAAAVNISDLIDTGLSFNDQRKLVYVGRDTLGRALYQIVYQSGGRIFTASGWRNDTTDQVVWNPEKLVSYWDDAENEFPALVYHEDSTGYPFHYVYQDSIGEVLYVTLPSGVPDMEYLTSTDSTLAPDAQPVIAGMEMPYKTNEGTAPPFPLDLDVVAWREADGIHVRSLWRQGTVYDTSHADEEISDQEFIYGDSTARWPTIWMDTCYKSNPDSSRAKVWLAWQQDTIIVGGPRLPTVPCTDIMAVNFEVVCGLHHTKPSLETLAGQSVVDVSYTTDPVSKVNIHPCISGCRLDTAHVMVRIAYERYQDPGDPIDWIAVAHLRTGHPWQQTQKFSSMDPANPFQFPSITVTRLGATTLRDNYYSVAAETRLGQEVEHWAFDSAALRVLSVEFPNVMRPQLAATGQTAQGRSASADTNVERVALASSASNPKTINPEQQALFKKSFYHDGPWTYRTLTEKDTSGKVALEFGIGEVSLDDGSNIPGYEPVVREDSISVDSAHPATWFMQTERMDIPASGMIGYYRWVRPSNDSLYKLHCTTTTYVVELRDTTGSLLVSLDTVWVSDTEPKRAGALRQIPYTLLSATKGVLQVRRLSNAAFATTHSTWCDITTRKLLSSQSNGMKQTMTGLSANGADNGLLLRALENPVRMFCDVGFYIPETGAVTAQVRDALGREIEELANEREFRAGEHVIRWIPMGNLPSGIYTVLLRYGNDVKSVQVAYVR